MVFSLIPFYLIGAYPTGYLIARSQGINILTAGSGNIGATNLGRVLGWRAGLLTLGGDILKGALAVFLAGYFTSRSWFPAYAAVATVAGHCFSIPPKLKGGKGVATSLGTILVLAPATAIIGISIFASLFAWTRTVSVSSMAALLSAPIASTLLSAPEPVSLALMAIALIVTYRHRANLRRLMEGKEERFSIHRSS